MNLYSAIIVSLVSIPLLSSENNHIITSHEKIHSIGFLNSNTVVVAGDKGCTLHTTNNNSEIYVSWNYVHEMDLSYNDKKISLVEPNQIVVYDISEKQTPKKIVSIPAEHAHNKIAFGNNVLFVYNSTDNSVTSYNFTTHKTNNNRRTYRFNQVISEPKNISYNSKKNELCVIDCTGCIKTFQPQQTTLVKKGSIQFYLTRLSQEMKPMSCSYNYDESMLAVNIANLGYLFYDSTHLLPTEPECIKKKINYDYISIAFHPNGTIAALLTYKAIELWNYKENKLIETIKLNNDNTKKYNLKCYGNKLSFSPSGTQIAAASKTKIYLIDITNLLYEQNAIQRYWLIGEIKKNNFPTEIIKLIQSNLTKIYPQIIKQEKPSSQQQSQEIKSHSLRQRFYQQLQEKWHAMPSIKKFIFYCISTAILVTIISATYTR